jgi:hypothetical protein
MHSATTTNLLIIEYLQNKIKYLFNIQAPYVFICEFTCQKNVLKYIFLCFLSQHVYVLLHTEKDKCLIKFIITHLS